MTPPLPYEGSQRRSITTTTLVRRTSCQTSQQTQTPQSTASTEAPFHADSAAQWFVSLWCRGPLDHLPSPRGGGFGPPLNASAPASR